MTPYLSNKIILSTDHFERKSFFISGKKLCVKYLYEFRLIRKIWAARSDIRFWLGKALVGRTRLPHSCSLTPSRRTHLSPPLRSNFRGNANRRTTLITKGTNDEEEKACHYHRDTSTLNFLWAFLISLSQYWLMNVYPALAFANPFAIFTDLGDLSVQVFIDFLLPMHHAEYAVDWLCLYCYFLLETWNVFCGNAAPSVNVQYVS